LDLMSSILGAGGNMWMTTVALPVHYFVRPVGWLVDLVAVSGEGEREWE